MEDQEKPTQQVEKNKVEMRKIPQTLIQSYDLVLLEDKKKRRFKQQDKTQTQSQILQKLKPMQMMKGSCSFQLKVQGKKLYHNYELMGDTITIEKVTTIHLKAISKIKLIGRHGEHENRKIKLSYGEEEVAFLMVENHQELYYLFANIIVRKLILEDFLINDINEGGQKSFSEAPKTYEGQIFKSQGMMGYKGTWQKRKMVIDQVLKSFRDDKCTFTLKGAKQIWTRFNMHMGFFVVKLHQGLEKIQLGIPLVDFTNITNPKNWLFPLTSLVET